MTIPRKNVVTTDQAGNTEAGMSFDDKPSASNISKARIKRITIWHANNYIGCLKVDYNNQQGFERGRRKGGSKVEILLNDDDYITVVEGNFYNDALSGLRLTTSKGVKYGPYAVRYSGYEMVWDASKLALDPTIKGDLGLLYFTGTCDDHIYSLSATFVNCAKANYISPVIKYEKRAPSSTGASECLEALPQFARNLMSPIVTLVVGPSKTEFFVYERVISRIPFFAAALDGRFSEAIQKKIVMPGENPESIAALIEFLYTGHYTYPYICEDMSSNVNVPTADHAEGVFHIGVYVAGDKYDCEELSKAAMVGIVNAMGELKGIECIRFWSEVYLSGLSIGLLKDFPNIGAQIVETLKVVYTDHGKEMAMIVRDIPELGNDFLKLSLGYSAV